MCDDGNRYQSFGERIWKYDFHDCSPDDSRIKKSPAKQHRKCGMNFAKVSVALKVIRRFLHGYILSLVALLADMQHVKNR